MIRSKTSLLTSAILIGGSFLMLTLPNWMSYTVLALVATAFTIYHGYNHSYILPKVWNFCIEFIGFCALVLCFIFTVVCMNQVLMP